MARRQPPGGSGQHTGTIKSVLPFVITDKHGNDHQLTISPSCRITLDGQVSTISALKAGQQCRVTVQGTMATGIDARSAANPPPPPPPPPPPGGLVALTTLGQSQFGIQAGLYPHGSNTAPANYIAPVLSAGPVVRFGMSNEFYETEYLLQNLPTNLRPGVKFVNCAHKSDSLHQWSNPADPIWSYFGQQLQAAGVQPNGFHCAIFQDAYRAVDPEMSGVTDSAVAMTVHKKGYQAVIKVLLSKYPQVQMVLLKSRTYGGYAAAGSPSNVEPYANAQGWAVGQVIADHIAGGDGINCFVDWGSHQWANGQTPNPGQGLASSGLVWLQNDYQSDGIHPSTPAGTSKCNMVELGYLHANPGVRQWMFV